MAGLARKVLAHRRLPLALALVAVVVMLPALTAGLGGDDVIQRVNQFPRAELPPRILDTGFVAEDSGALGSVVNNLFGFCRSPERAVQARDYGLLPWWAPLGWKAALWRPLTAFTHWLDYRLFPKSIALMHAHNIAWFAMAVFLAAALYRKIAVSAGGAESNLVVPGLAACLWLLDKDTYMPVAYVANRGFFISLVFGLLCLHAHWRWRAEKSKVWMGLSALCLLLALLANEGGVSTLAFLLACALVLETGGWRARLASLFPAAVVLIGWRAVYVGAGFGVKHWQGYVDPGYSPFVYLENFIPRVDAILGGQLLGIPPELLMLLNTKWTIIVSLLAASFSLACAAVFWPVLREDRTARFWAVAMLLALPPAATVGPLSKNLGFIALGAFGVIAAFLVRFAEARGRTALAWFVAAWLVVAHVFGALGARAVMAVATPYTPAVMERATGWEYAPEIGERDVVVVNDPILTFLIVPFDRAYRGRPVPKTLRALAPGCVPFEISRSNASTLVIRAKEGGLFGCPALGPANPCYLAKAANDFLFGGTVWHTGDEAKSKAFTARILDASPEGAPRSVAFDFGQPLESDGRIWLYFDWRRLAHLPFTLPKIGETVEIAGVESFGR
ncbi:MAG TPA: hypothetical protein VGO59_03445 [Verrucomicrobiae bacterium]|jgi:hypothetical protein